MVGYGGIWWDLVGSGGIWWWGHLIPPDPGNLWDLWWNHLIPRISLNSHLWHSGGGSLWNQRNSIVEKSNPPRQNKSEVGPVLSVGSPLVPHLALLQGGHRAGGCHQCIVRVRERSAAEAGSARALLQKHVIEQPPSGYVHQVPVTGT
jgi:hypothetical protein